MTAPPGLLERIKRDRDGVLPVEVYRRLFETASIAGGGTFVEIGTAWGAATIVLALGARAGGTPFHIYTVDGFDVRLAPRWAGGTVAENHARLRAGLAAFGVQDDVTSLVGDSVDLVAALRPADIRLLLIDADGRIDRDLALLFDRLAPDAAIVVDDMDGAPVLDYRTRRRRVDLKHVVTRLLVDALVERGLLVPDGVVRQTGFYRKGLARLDEEEWRRMALPVYRQLVNVELAPGLFSLRTRLRRRAERHVPALLAWIRRLRGLQ